MLSAPETYAVCLEEHDKPIGSVGFHRTAGTLEKFYAHLKSDGRLVRREIYGEGLANSVIRSIHAHCRASLEKARFEGLIRQNPAVHCKLPPKKSAEVEVLTVEEMQRLLIQAKEEGFYEMFLLDLSTGLRRGELLALMWDDINLETGELKVNKQVRYFNKELHIMPPKTKAAYRTIILPLPLIEMLKEYRKKVRSKWLFPSPYKREQDLPRDPCACRKKLSQILEHAGCKQVPFHALRHTFATQALRYGMDVKTLACTIGHESVETTLNVYSHATDEGMRTAAKTIDKTIGSLAGSYAELEGGESEDEQVPTEAPKPTPRTKFEPYRGKYRRQGTGSIHQVSKNVWEGRYSPIINGKRITRNIYAGNIEECEKKLAQMIGNICDLITVDSEDEEAVNPYNTLNIIQKKIKYGVSTQTAISICEKVFNDRIIATKIAEVLRDEQIDADDIIQTLKFYEDEIRDVLNEYPEYFMDRFNFVIDQI